MDQVFPLMHLVGRVMFSAIFVASSIGQLVKLEETTAYALSKGMPAPRAAVVVASIVMGLGGLSVLLGWHRFIGAGLLFLFLVTSAFTMHAFWKEQDPESRQNEMAHFMKDLSLAGAALLLAFYGGNWWPLSLGG